MVHYVDLGLLICELLLGWRSGNIFEFDLALVGLRLVLSGLLRSLAGIVGVVIGII